MKVLVITSCTGEKAVETTNDLTLADFRQGATHVEARESALAEHLLPAEQMYTGMQHQRLMRGVQVARQSCHLDVDLHILSAGYGLIPAHRIIAPYETTFAGMRTAELAQWGAQLHVPTDLRALLAAPYDLALILLGEDYLKACAIDAHLALAGPTIFFCSGGSSKQIPQVSHAHRVPLGNAHARAFSCGLVGLKGEIAARILERLSEDPTRIVELLQGADELLSFAKVEQPSKPATRKAKARPRPEVDRVIALPESWRNKPHRERLTYFIPEWDDLVDGDFEFETDTHAGGSGDWSNEVYAHQMYPSPNYDGILISKVVAEKSKKKAERINRLGVHRYLRVPRDFPVMGDCGAFGYIDAYEPPYTTSDILDYYTRLDFDYGVSIDHFALGSESERRRKYQLTIQNAEDFLKEHHAAGHTWTPIGAVQGWDEKSFADAAGQYAKMGYRYIALGAMVRRRTPEILSIVQAVRKVIPVESRVHLFGVARLNAVDALTRAGINSADSASVLRRAWMGTGKNYLALDGRQFAAIRVPEANKSFRAKRMVSEGRASADQVSRMEQNCMALLRQYDVGQASIEVVLDALAEYDHLITPDRGDNSSIFRETLEARPWKTCPCAICQRDGIEVVIFRGNNRNRRRGFHNTYVFYELMQRVLAGERLPMFEDEEAAPSPQLGLFEAEVA